MTLKTTFKKKPATARLYVYAHNKNSESAINLARELGASRIKHESSNFKGSPNKIVINWGSSNLPFEVSRCQVLNTAEAVDICSNKMAFFQAVDGKCAIPEWTTNKAIVKEWVDTGAVVFARTKLRSSGGLGIVEINSPAEITRAPLYTKYIPKKDEYRVHVMAGKAFLIQRKALSAMHNADSLNWHIRNHANGFIFARNEGTEPQKGVVEEALKAFSLIPGLTFGSVDVIYNVYRKKAYVLEINTASGLEGSTIDDYRKVFKEYLNA